MTKTEKINVGLNDRSYPILIGPNLLKAADTYLYDFVSNRHCIIISDTTIGPIYQNLLAKTISPICGKLNNLQVPSGENSKSLSVFTEICNDILNIGIDRNTILIALGGGVIGDLVGFASASLLRGIDYIQIPTTLLSQVDSSVGGKTAINIPEGKNLVGAFYNPKAVFISTRFLKTLSEKEYKSGLGEVIKYSLIDNEKLRTLLQSNTKKILNRDNKILLKIIEESIKTKSKIVTKDEKESGIRAILNFGHTFGHAIEAHTNYKKMSHGAAITLGMIIASKISLYEGLIKDHQLDNIINLIDSLGLDTNYSKYKFSELKKYIFNDKKVADGKLNLILINQKFKAFKTNQFDQNNIGKAFK